MSDAAVKPAVEHLHCDRCGDNPSLAKVDGEAKIVCHCTHVNGVYSPVPVESIAILPMDWHWDVNGGESDE